MSSLPPPTAPRFLKPTQHIQRVTVLTGVHWWHGHYDPERRRPVRCGGSLCRWCDSGRQPELRIVLGVADGHSQRWLIELRERHRTFIESLESQAEGVIGTVVEMWKQGSAMNSPVEFSIVRHKAAMEWDIRLLVEGLGVET